MTGDLLLSQYIEGFLLARKADGYSTGALEQYEWALDRLLFVIGDKPLKEIRIDDLRQYMAWMQSADYVPKSGKKRIERLSPTSVFHAWKAVKAFYSWIENEWKIPRPDTHLTKPKFQYPEVTPFTDDEIKKLIAATEFTRESETSKRRGFKMKRPTANRDKAIVLLLVDTGIRAGELSRLQLDDVDIPNREIIVNPYKSGLKSRARIIPFGVRCQKVLWRYQAERVKIETLEKNFFLSTANEPLNRDSLRHLIVELGERAHVPNCYPHRFRHTFAIEYLRNGGDVGSPPHAWGQLFQFLVIRKAAAVHPHMRGDNSPPARPDTSLVGSPPHAWGQL